MRTHTTTSELLLLEDLDDAAKASHLDEGDRAALDAIAGWIRGYVVQPNDQLGRAGTVCPFVPVSLERKVLWLVPERIADRDASDVVELLQGYKRRLLDTDPPDAAEASLRVFVVVFTDLSAERAKRVFTEALEQISSPAYVDDGIIFGPYYAGHEGTAVYSEQFHPFESPVPFVFVRHTVVEDWKFFVDDDDGLERWAGRFGAAGARALGAQLRALPWRDATRCPVAHDG